MPETAPPNSNASAENKPVTEQKKVQARRMPSITDAFKDGVSINNQSTPETLLNYVDTCAKVLFVHPNGVLFPISEHEYEVTKYFTTQCIQEVFGGNYDYVAPEPLYITIEELEQEREQFKEKAEAGETPSIPQFDVSTFKPRVVKDKKPEGELKFQVPVEYQDTPESATNPIPVSTMKEDGKTTDIKTTVKLQADLTDQDKIFLKNRYMSVMHSMYRKFVESSARFEMMCVRGKELMRKMTTRRARRCWTTNVDHTEEGGTTLELIPNPKGNHDLKNINMWYAEFCQIYTQRAQIWRNILSQMGEIKRLQESPTWDVIVGEQIIDWAQRLEKFVLAPGKDDLLKFIKSNELSFDDDLSDKDTDPVKDASMFHFFKVAPRIILQLAIAKPTKDGIFGDEQLRKDADNVVE